MIVPYLIDKILCAFFFGWSALLIYQLHNVMSSNAVPHSENGARFIKLLFVSLCIMGLNQAILFFVDDYVINLAMKTFNLAFCLAIRYLIKSIKAIKE